MKNIKLLTATLICISLFNPKGIVQAEEIINNTEPVSVEFETSEQIAERLSLSNEYGKVIAKEPIQLGQQSLELYVEFENPKDALSKFVKSHNSIFSYLKTEYILDEVSMNNFDDYYYSFLNSLNTKNTPYKDNYEIEYSFRLFYDIFENTSSNEKIKQAVNKIKNTPNFIVMNDSNNNLDSELLELALILPYYDNFAIQANEYILKARTSNISTYALSGTSLSKAIAYAKKYATSINWNYGYLSADCANFASQILEAAGKNQSNTGSEYSGWWHTATVIPGTNFEPDSLKHEYSISWIRADRFARYWGIYKNCFTITDLGGNVKAGDFLAEDIGGDGNYDHIGFVTEVTNNTKSITENGITRTYKDFVVAQHNIDYIKLASLSGWIKFNNNKKVAIVGR